MLLMRRKNFSYLFVQCVYIHWSNFWKFWSNVIDFRLKWKLFKMCFSIYSYKSRNIREISFTLFVGRNYHENGTKTNNTFLRLNMLLMSRVTNNTFIPKKMLLMRRKNFSYLFVQCVYIHWSNFWKFWWNVIDFRLKWKLFKKCVFQFIPINPEILGKFPSPCLLEEIIIKMGQKQITHFYD